MSPAAVKAASAAPASARSIVSGAAPRPTDGITPAQTEHSVGAFSRKSQKRPALVCRAPNPAQKRVWIFLALQTGNRPNGTAAVQWAGEGRLLPLYAYTRSPMRNSPKYAGRWKAGSGFSIGDQQPKCGESVSSPHL